MKKFLCFVFLLFMTGICWAGTDYETPFDNHTGATASTTWSKDISYSDKVNVQCILGNATGVMDVEFDNDGSNRQHFRTFSSTGTFQLPVEQTWKHIFLRWRSKEKTHPFKPIICHVKTLEE